MKKTFLTLLLLLVLPLSAQAEQRFVQKVMDATTLKLLSGDTVTLLGIDIQNASSEEQDKIAAEVRGLISGSVVKLEYETSFVSEDGTIPAYVWFEYVPRDALEIIEFLENYQVKYQEDREGFGSFLVFLNASLVKSGHAVPEESFKDGRYSELFQRLYDERDSDLAQHYESPLAVGDDVVSKE